MLWSFCFQSCTPLDGFCPRLLATIPAKFDTHTTTDPHLKTSPPSHFAPSPAQRAPVHSPFADSGQTFSLPSTCYSHFVPPSYFNTLPFQLSHFKSPLSSLPPQPSALPPQVSGLSPLKSLNPHALSSSYSSLHTHRSISPR